MTQTPVTYYAAHDDTCIHGVGTDRDTVADEAARDAGYDDEADLIAQGNRGYDVTEIDAASAQALLDGDATGSDRWSVIDGVVRLYGIDAD